MLEGRGVWGREGQRGKNWDNCNNIVNKTYLKKDKVITLDYPSKPNVITGVLKCRRGSQKVM